MAHSSDNMVLGINGDLRNSSHLQLSPPTCSGAHHWLTKQTKDWLQCREVEQKHFPTRCHHWKGAMQQGTNALTVHLLVFIIRGYKLCIAKRRVLPGLVWVIVGIKRNDGDHNNIRGYRRAKHQKEVSVFIRSLGFIHGRTPSSLWLKSGMWTLCYPPPCHVCFLLCCCTWYPFFLHFFYTLS